ncbi:sulfur oxidation c-type cytochrome SoxA [Limnohabitans sp. Jir72]|uniref:sulfur oxidation c-type cytochrome SoxA n=1 Tax=Limnohabitans sp. Jir72 TaxID=1977909 RepID=UPI000D354E4C|nr:sulfur oxidation c-type cytochrome SoxA [Limnohabitans sp. Jir72]PUE35134.1 sulfur oxidation c-type cytochrome SoxA [Limnohabitans sp. Jir72]
MMARLARWTWLAAVALIGMGLPAAMAQPSPVRALPLSQLKSGLHFSGKDVQALQADEFANPAQLWLSQGAAQWKRSSGANGPSCFSCHGDVANMKGVATRYPAIDPASGRLFNLEDRINHCTTRHQQATVLAPESDALLGLTWYVTQASKGLPIRVDIGGNARPHWQAGADLFQRRQGQLNLSCAQCHDQHFGQRLYTDALSQGQPNAYPVYRLEWQKPGSLERRLRSCYAGIRAETPPWGATEMRQLALYLMWRGEGLPIEVPAVRK